MALRIFRHMTGNRTMKSDSVSKDEKSEVLDQLSQPQASETEMQVITENAAQIVTDHDPVPVNDDVWRKRFHKVKGLTRFRRRWRIFLRMFKHLFRFMRLLGDKGFSRDEKLHMLRHMHEWHPDDLEEYRRQKDMSALNAFHISQAKLLKPRIVDTLVRLKFCTFVMRSEREYIRQRPAIGRVEVTPTAYTFYITRIPFGVKTTDMIQDWVSTELSVTMGKRVRGELEPQGGPRFTVMIASTNSIPNFVPFREAKDMPKNLPPLGIFIGRSTNGSPIYRDIAEGPHLLIGGGSGKGKSNSENAIACTLIMRNDPRIVKLVFFDLKGGVEFGIYSGIPHLFALAKGDWSCDGIVEFPRDVMPAFEALMIECNARLAKLKKAKVRNIAEYNRGKHIKNRIPYIVVFVDEWATTKKLAGDQVEDLLANLANLSRATGIHVVLASQNPKSEIINTTITVNFLWRLAFEMSQAASQAILGNWNAFGLNPKGRCIYQSNDGEIEVQTPRITNSTVAAILTAARTGGNIAEMMNVDAEEILDWALENTRGKLEAYTIHEAFKEKITQAALRDLLKSMENQAFDIHGTLYNVRPAAGNQARRMERMDDEGVSDAQNSDRQPSTDKFSPIASEELS